MKQHFDIEKHLREELELSSPSPDFSKKIMGAVKGTRMAPPSHSYINKKILFGTALFFLLLMAGALAYALSSFKAPVAAGELFSSMDLNKLDVRQYFSRKTLNSLLFLNVLLGLVFLDKYFIRRPHAL